jgi:hypothetical protein
VFIQTGAAPLPNGPIYAIGESTSTSTTLYLGGYFNSTQGSPNMAKLSSVSATSVYSKLATTDPSSLFITSVDTCNPIDLQLDCTAGSSSYVGPNFLQYFNAKTSVWSTFGNGTNGVARKITSAYLINSASSYSILFSLSFTIIFSLIF